jgi:hypothetical protein
LKSSLRLFDLNVVDKVECDVFHFVQVIVIASQILEFVFPLVEDSRYAFPDVDFALDLQVGEGWGAEAVFAESFTAARNGAGSGTVGEDAVDAGFAPVRI